jgi:hypothetical protein
MINHLFHFLQQLTNTLFNAQIPNLLTLYPVQQHKDCSNLPLQVIRNVLKFTAFKKGVCGWRIIQRH